MTLTQEQRDYLAKSLREKQANYRKWRTDEKFWTGAANYPGADRPDKFRSRAAVAKACADMWLAEINHLRKFIRSLT